MKAPKVYLPQIQVRLHKTIGRTAINGSAGTSDRFRSSAANGVIDLTEHLGDGGSVSTSKGISEAAGSWVVSLSDKALQRLSSFETVYGLVEPMDMIEIRMRHGAADSAGPLPVVMRGFVTDVQRSESMGADGRPHRAVVIRGHDYGKIWEIIQINFAAGLLLGKALISSFQLFEQFGVGFTTALSTKEFFESVITKVLNPYLDTLMPSTSELPRAITPAAQDVGGTVSPGIQAQQGSIFELVRTFCDVGPWNEVFIEDRDDGVYCVLRANPYIKPATDQMIPQGGPPPVYVDVDAADLVSISVSRSDANVSNFYWVDGARFTLVADPMLYLNKLAEANSPTVVLANYGNCRSSLYGIRLMRVSTNQGETSMSTHNPGGKKAENEAMTTAVELWVDARRKILVESNKDNVLLESGTIRVRGNEALRPGRYLRLRRGGIVSTYYIIHVAHEFVQFGTFVTTLQVTRGTGFADRIALGGSPYLSELADAA